MDISLFKGNFAHGARPNLYEVLITGVADPKVRFLCKATQLPGSNLGETIVPYMGRELKIAGDRTFENWEVTIINDTDFGIRSQLEEWSNRINGHQSNVGSVTMDDYMRQGVISQLDRDGSVLYTYTINDIWPSLISPIEMSYETNNTVEEYTVTFTISTYWSSPGANS